MGNTNKDPKEGAQAQANASKKARDKIEELNASLNQPRRALAREGSLPLSSLSEVSQNSKNFTTRLQNREQEYKSSDSEVFAYIATDPRPPNIFEKNRLDKLYSATSGSRDFEYVKYYANGTPTDAIPDFSSLNPGSYSEKITPLLLPEALRRIGDGDAGAGTIVTIEYMDTRNHLDPVIRSQTGTGEPAVQFDYSAASLAEVKNLFYDGEKPKENLFDDIGKTRALKDVTTFVLHETVSNTATKTIATLKNKRNIGIHYILSETGELFQTANWNRKLYHASTSYLNSTSIGVEVVSPYYGKARNGPEGEYVKKTWPKFIKNAPWAHEGSYILPTPKQMEAVWKLTQKLTSPKSGLSIPLKFVGFERDNGRLVITGNQNYLKAEGPGIYAHSYKDHADGASLSLYCFCRAGGLDPQTAYNVLFIGLDGAAIKRFGNNYYVTLEQIKGWTGKELKIPDPDKPKKEPKKEEKP